MSAIPTQECGFTTHKELFLPNGTKIVLQEPKNVTGNAKLWLFIYRKDKDIPEIAAELDTNKASQLVLGLADFLVQYGIEVTFAKKYNAE